MMMSWSWRASSIAVFAASLLTAAASFALPAGTDSAATVVLPNDGTLLREGAGNYYPIIEILGAGTSVIPTGAVSGWLDVLVRDDDGGWISENALVAASEGLTALPDTSGDRAPRKVNLAAIGAMIKGLSGQMGASEEEAARLLAQVPVDPAAVASFRASFQLPGSRDDATGETGATTDTLLPGDTSMLPDYLALSPVIAAQIVAAWGGSREDLHAYGNQILLWLADRAGADNLAPSLQITRNGSNSVSLPGGWIVLGGDLVTYCRDEAELAAIIAHELSHAIAHHGYQAMRGESWRLRSDDAFAELRERSGTDPARDVPGLAELEAYGTSVLQQARRRHDLPMELAADQDAARLLLAGGYDPRALLDLLQRMREEFGDRLTGHGSISMAWLNSRDELDERIAALQKQIGKLNRDELDQLAQDGRFVERFRESVLE